MGVGVGVAVTVVEGVAVRLGDAVAVAVGMGRGANRECSSDEQDANRIAATSPHPADQPSARRLLMLRRSN